MIEQRAQKYKDWVEGRISDDDYIDFLEKLVELLAARPEVEALKEAREILLAIEETGWYRISSYDSVKARMDEWLATHEPQNGSVK